MYHNYRSDDDDYDEKDYQDDRNEEIWSNDSYNFYIYYI